MRMSRLCQAERRHSVVLPRRRSGISAARAELRRAASIPPVECSSRDDSQTENPYSLRCIAEHFAKAIREKRPRGPYMLGGWCAHGVLALETAQILREQGEDVALLVLLETINPERLRKQRRFVQIMATLQAKMNLRGFGYKHVRATAEHHSKEHVSGRFALKNGIPQTAQRG